MFGIDLKDPKLGLWFVGMKFEARAKTEKIFFTFIGRDRPISRSC